MKRNLGDSETLRDILPRRLREARRRAGLTQAEVADAAGLDENVYARYERAERLPSVEILDRLCDAVGCSADWLLGETTPAPPARPQDDDDPTRTRRIRRIHRGLRKASPDILELVRSVLDAVIRDDTP